MAEFLWAQPTKYYYTTVRNLMAYQNNEPKTGIELTRNKQPIKEGEGVGGGGIRYYFQPKKRTI